MSPRDHGRQARRGRPEQAETFVVGVLAKQGRFVVLEPFFDLVERKRR